MFIVLYDKKKKMFRTYTIVMISDTITNLPQLQNKYVELQPPHEMIFLT